MSVKQLESEIAKLAPAELQQLAAWLGEFCSSDSTHARPPLAGAVFTPVKCSPDAFAPLTDEELKDFGLA